MTSKLGQAITELATIGVIMLVVLGALLRYGQMMSAQQEIKMYAHRKALELAKMRRDSGEYGQVSLVAMKEIFPVNIFSSAREPTYVSASSSVSLHEGTGYYKDGIPDRTQPEHVGVTYYQIGANMINNNQVLVMPSVLLKRKIDEDNAPTTAVDADMNWLKDVFSFGQSGNDPEDYESLEPVSIVNMHQFIRSIRSNKYESSETPTDSSYDEEDVLTTTQTTTYEFIDEETLKEWDEDIIELIDMPEDVVIQQIKTVEQEREWTTPH